MVKSLLVLEHEIDGTAELVGEDRKRLGFAVLMSKSLEILFGRFIALEEEDGGLGEGPFEVGVTDLFTAGSVFFAVGLFDALDQRAVGDEILDGGEAVDVFDLVKDDETQDFADAGD